MITQEQKKSWFNKLVTRLNPKEDIFFKYNVVDCEHMGDIEHEESYVQKTITPFNGEVVNTYWDGNDCGEAWIEAKIPFNEENLFKLIEHGEFYDFHNKLHW